MAKSRPGQHAAPALHTPSDGVRRLSAIGTKDHILRDRTSTPITYLHNYFRHGRSCALPNQARIDPPQAYSQAKPYPIGTAHRFAPNHALHAEIPFVSGTKGTLRGTTLVEGRDLAHPLPLDADNGGSRRRLGRDPA